MSIGLWHVAVSAFCYSVMSTLVKLCGARIPSQEIVLARVVVTLVMSVVTLRGLGIRPWGTQRGWLVARGLVGFGGLSCFYYGITALPLADATVLQYTNPVLTAALAALVLRERMTAHDVVGMVVSLVGVVMVVRPQFLFGTSSLDGWAVLVSLAGAVFSAFAYVIVRKLRDTEHPMVIVFYFPLVSLPLAIPAAIPSAVWPGPLDWVLLVGVGVATQLAQVFMTRGLHAETAGRATAVSYLQVVFAYVLGILVFHEIPTALSVVGAALIVGGTLVVARGRG
ncbi:MAG: DMT family transporter [Myxococcota bacterium]